VNVVELGVSIPDTSSHIENWGLIKGAAIAILAGAGQETVVNHGRIVGDVDLGGGDDTFVFGEGGVLAGDLVLGGGNDSVVIENGAGTTSIADFVAGGGNPDDVIDVSAFFSNFDELTDNSSDGGGGVVITLDRNDTLVLTGVSLSDLNAGDFLFVLS
jgi:hypothetical protein